MNINKELRKVFNTIKFQSEKWDKELKENNKEPMNLYYSAYFGGALDMAKILMKLWNGEISDSELERELFNLDNPTNERKAS